MNFTSHPVDDEGWTKWIRPRRTMYRLRCCDCRLVHDMQFKVQRGIILFRARRNEELTDDSRAKQERKKAAAKAAKEARAASQAAAKAAEPKKETIAAQHLPLAAWHWVKCPTCHSNPWERCVTKHERKSFLPHAARIASGKALEWRKAKLRGSNHNGRTKAR